MSTTPSPQHDPKKQGNQPPANGGAKPGTTPAAAAAPATPKKAKKAPTPKDVFVVFGTTGAQTLKHFKQLVNPDKKGEKGEDLFITAKKQAEDFVNAADAPDGPFVIIVGNARKTKQKL